MEPRSGRTPRRALRYAGLAAAYLVLYLAAAVWAKELSIPGPVLIWFPPAGVAIGLLYLRPGLFPVAVAAEVASTTLVMGMGEAFGVAGLAVNSLVIAGAYLVSATVLRALHLDPELRTLRDLAVFALGALAVGPTVAAFPGVAVQVWVGLVEGVDYLEQVGVFWVGDVVGIACVAPVLLIGGSPVLARRPLRLSDRAGDEPVALTLGAYVAPALLAVVLFELGSQPEQFLYLVMVPVILVAVRHGVEGAALATAGLTAVVSVLAHVGMTDALERSDLQLLLTIVTLTGLVVGATVSARNDVLEGHRRLSDIVEATPDLVGSATADGTIRYLNPVGRRLIGIGPTELASRHAFDFYPDELSVDLLREAMRAAERNGTWVGENTLRRADGQLIPVSQVLIAHRFAGDDSTTYSTVCRDMTDQRRLEAQLRNAVLYDDHTGLANRALLVEHLGRLVATGGRQRPVAVMFADVDRFRVINESRGYSVGDDVVLELARRLEAAVEAPDLVSRYGGGRFAVVIAEVDDEFDAVVVADRVLGALNEPVLLGADAVHVAGSVGVALETNGATDHLDLLRCAEIALHRAKERGGARFAVFDEDMERRSKQRIETEADLRRVLTTGEWWLAYQPIVDAKSEDVVSCEALLRWTHPERGPVAPFEMIRLAENTGLIVPLGREIFRRACVEAVAWHRGGHDLPVAINVSGRQLAEPGFLSDVGEVIEETGIDPGSLVIEVTETVLAQDIAAEVHALGELRRRGCAVAIDDFGTGYSSLGGLRDLPIDIVKLDRSFITELVDSAASQAMVEAVINLADAIGVTVVAEGVEEPEQANVLRRLGCDRLQGFAISYPLDPSGFSDLLGADR